MYDMDGYHFRIPLSFVTSFLVSEFEGIGTALPFANAAEFAQKNVHFGLLPGILVQISKCRYNVCWSIVVPFLFKS